MLRLDFFFEGISVAKGQTYLFIFESPSPYNVMNMLFGILIRTNQFCTFSISAHGFFDRVMFSGSYLLK